MHSTDNAVLIHLGAIGSGVFALVLSHVASLAFRKPWLPTDRATALEESNLAASTA